MDQNQDTGGQSSEIAKEFGNDYQSRPILPNFMCRASCCDPKEKSCDAIRIIESNPVNGSFSDNSQRMSQEQVNEPGDDKGPHEIADAGHEKGDLHRIGVGKVHWSR